MDPISLIVGLIVSIVSAGASMLIKSMMGQDKKQVPGVRGSRQVGGTNPLAFIVGTYGTAGQFEYGGEWGNDGETPNAFRSEVYSYCDLPAEGLSGRYIAGVRVTLDDVAHAELGYPVLEYRVDGKDYLWFRDYDGTQVAADALLLAKFGADPDRPWADDMVFPGVAYSVVTSLWNRELFAGAIPEPMFEDMGIWFYDVRKDSTAGGVGTHRLDDPSTWAWTDNPIVIIYGILLGIKYEGEWIWGGQDITQNHLPFANWAAQMDKCDALVSIPGGGTEKRFRCGYEISVDLEPQAVIGELLKTCEGRIAEIGGIYKVLVGEPDAPVVAVTPDDIVVSDQQTFEPFPGLENLFNEMRADYPEPGEAWEMKEAPPRLRSDLVLADDGRRLPFSTSYKAAPFGNQVQRLMYGAIEEARRFARLVKTHPPEFWEYEPLDCYALTDPQDGFVNKTFLITAMDDLPNGNQVVGAQEVDPADYNPPDGFELPWDITPLQIARPAPQEVSGFHVEQGTDTRRTSVDVFWSAASVTVDVEFVRISHRRAGDTLERWVGLIPRPTLLLGSARVFEALLPNDPIEVQIQYVPHSGRVTIESSWLPVTTPDIRLGIDDIYPIDIDQFNAGLAAWQENIGNSVRDAREAIQRINLLVGNFSSRDRFDKQTLRQDLVAAIDGNTAKWSHQVDLLAAQDIVFGSRIEAIELTIPDLATVALTDVLQGQITVVDGKANVNAAAITDLMGTVGYVSGQATFRLDMSYVPSAGWTTGFALQARVGAANAWRSVGIYGEVTAAAGRLVLDADQIIIRAGGTIAALFDAGTTFIANARMTNFIASWAQISTAVVTNFVAASANIGTAVIVAAKIGDLEVGTLKLANGAVNTLYKDSRLTAFTAPAAGSSGLIDVSSLTINFSSYAGKLAAWVNISTGTTGVFTITVTLSVTIAGVDIILSAMAATNGSKMVHRLYVSANIIPGPPGNYAFKVSLSANCVGSAITLEFAADVPQK